MDSQIDMIVLAAGKGRRMKSALNKMFHEINGIPILYRTLHRINSYSIVNRIVVVISKEDKKSYRDMLLRFGSISKIEIEVWGGEERADSVRNGLRSFQDNPGSEIVMTHDGARPFFSEDLLYSLLESASRSKVAVPGIRIYETMRYKRKGEKTRIMDRENLYIIQTPQAFQSKYIEECFFHKSCIHSNLTDDAAFFENQNYDVQIVEGEKWNIKVTKKEDILWAETLLNQYPSLRLSIEK